MRWLTGVKPAAGLLREHTMSSNSLTIAHWCVLVAALLPIVCAGIAKSGTIGKPPLEGGYDNDNPRAWLDHQTTWRARANAAQANSFEALPFFIGAVLIAHQLGANQGWVDGLALAYIALRLMFIWLYVKGHANLRSLVWTLAFAINISILFVA